MASAERNVSRSGAFQYLLPSSTSEKIGQRAVKAAYLPGQRQVDLKEVPDPVPGPRQVLLSTRASTICGSDLRAIYREHLGEGAEAYQDVVAGHEPSGRVIAVGDEVTTLTVGDRVVVYHISGCGLCAECRSGYQISCTSSERRAYGWQRDGGHADLMVAEERDLIRLPQSLSYLDGACVACGFGTAYEALCRTDVSGRDEVLVVGLGPVGLATGLLAKSMGASRVVGTDPSEERRALALQLGAVDVAAADGDEVKRLLPAGSDVSVDCSGVGPGQLTALDNTRRWGRVALVGEGGQLSIDVSESLIHKQLTVHGSWVTSTLRMAELLDRLDKWGLRPSVIVTNTFPLDEAGDAYALADSGIAGKVGIVWPES